MGTYVQGIEYMKLEKEGWTSVPVPEYTPETGIGGPIEMVSPAGTRYWLMPDGTLKEDLPA